MRIAFERQVGEEDTLTDETEQGQFGKKREEERREENGIGNETKTRLISPSVSEFTEFLSLSFSLPVWYLPSSGNKAFDRKRFDSLFYFSIYFYLSPDSYWFCRPLSHPRIHSPYF